MKAETNRGSDPTGARSGAELTGTDEMFGDRLSGIGYSPWLWGPRIRILFVVDGRIESSKDPIGFGLGWVLETLSTASLPWWVQLEVTFANRDDPDAWSGPEGADIRDHRSPDERRIDNFRFTNDGFDINNFEQVWFFGDWPGLDGNRGGDDIIGRDEYRPLDDAELLIVADWMDRGGGVFAAGDHAILGASMCHRIPRVRTMRRWTHAQGVPSFLFEDRNETLVRNVGGQDDWEGDRSPQPIFPVTTSYSLSGFVWQGSYPHPILCGRSGVIDHFPDHMHEGGVFEDDDVRLDDPLNIPGFDKDEYPTVKVGVVTTAFAMGPGNRETGAFRIRPRPKVIAYGLTTHQDAPRRFPMISVYDGGSVGVGRVVVDSTWHHWFSMNLNGFLLDLSSGYYAGMQDYYRNIALWLCNSEQRTSLLFAATWGALVGSHPGAFDPSLGIWGLGERVVNIMTRSMSQCFLSDLVAPLVGTIMESRSESSPRLEADDRSRLWSVSRDTLNTAVVGGIAIRMLEQAHYHIKERAHGRETRLDHELVRRLGFEGLAAAKRELVEGFTQASDRFLAVRDLLAEGTDRTESR